MRQLALEGLVVESRSGRHRHPAVTILAQQRERLKFTTVQLGASPLSRDSLSPRSPQDDGDDIFD